MEFMRSYVGSFFSYLETIPKVFPAACPWENLTWHVHQLAGLEDSILFSCGCCNKVSQIYGLKHKFIL